MSLELISSSGNPYNTQSQISFSDKITDHKETKNNENALKETPLDTVLDPVSISDTAQLAAKEATQNAFTTYYDQFLPTYDGFSSAGLSAGVTNPGQETFSAGKTFDQVAIDARQTLDRKNVQISKIHSQLEQDGKLDGSTSSKDWNSRLGEFDRRALYAIASNEGGLFSESEQSFATDKMRQQQGLAMGLYSGPISAKDNFRDPFIGNSAGRYKASVQFLDQVSNEEKATSIEWAQQRAGSQKAYEDIMQRDGKEPENFDISHPLVNLLLLAMDNAGEKPPAENSADYESDGGPIDSDDLRELAWFEDYKDQLDEAIAETRELYLQDDDD